MSVLLDVNFLLACGWKSHPENAAANAWLADQPTFMTCPITELGFLRVSMSPAFGADFVSAMEALKDILKLPGSRFISADIRVTELPKLARYADTTDAYLVSLAKKHSLKFATLDRAVLSQEWSRGWAFNPLRM